MSEDSEIFANAAKGAGALAIQGALNAILGATLFMYMARVLTAKELGIYAAINILIAVASWAALIAMDMAMARFIPKLLGERKFSTASATAKRILRITVLCSSLFLCIFFVASPIFSSYMLGDMKYVWFFQLASFMILASALGTLFDAILQGLRRFEKLALYRLLSQIIRVALTTYLLAMGFSVAAPLIGSIILSVTLITFILPTALKSLLLVSSSKSIPVKKLFSFSLPILGQRIIVFASDNIDKLIVLGALTVETLGVYSIAITGASLPALFGIPILTTLIPSMSESYGKFGIKSINEALKLSIRYTTITFIPLSLTLAALSPLAIQILAGPAYSQATLPLTIICLGISLYGFSAVLLSALTALGKTGRIMVAIAIATTAELITAFFLTRFIGVIGAAISRALMYIALLTALAILSSKLIPLNFNLKFLARSLLASSAVTICTFLAAMTTSFNPTLIPLYLIIALTSYAIFFPLTRAVNLNDIYFVAKAMPFGSSTLNLSIKIFRSSRPLYKFAKWLLHV
jgi:O-antigen/teichoic acid export membrane protein